MAAGLKGAGRGEKGQAATGLSQSRLVAARFVSYLKTKIRRLPGFGCSYGGEPDVRFIRSTGSAQKARFR
ncbi:MAG: hypothetical protein CML23_17240 [Rhizobiaceae bacterium]|nr:hypothetical protein [Rhizobiaceae bacterium]|tara:strand:- start:214 stop:423 length:210 start_codon:yes stop_codon:yes gene_type:complete